MKKQLLMGLLALSAISVQAQENRALWASINNVANATDRTYKGNNGKVLVSWRLLPTDAKNVAFDLYRTVDGVETKVNSSPIVGVTKYQDKSADKTKDTNRSTDNKWYNLMGMEVSKPSNGVFIHKGKKVVLR